MSAMCGDETIYAQDMMQYLSMKSKEEVWGSFGSGLRTLRPNLLLAEGELLTLKLASSSLEQAQHRQTHKTNTYLFSRAKPPKLTDLRKSSGFGSL